MKILFLVGISFLSIALSGCATSPETSPEERKILLDNLRKPFLDKAKNLGALRDYKLNVLARLYWYEQEGKKIYLFGDITVGPDQRTFNKYLHVNLLYPDFSHIYMTGCYDENVNSLYKWRYITSELSGVASNCYVSGNQLNFDIMFPAIESALNNVDANLSSLYDKLEELSLAIEKVPDELKADLKIILSERLEGKMTINQLSKEISLLVSDESPTFISLIQKRKEEEAEQEKERARKQFERDKQEEVQRARYNAQRRIAEAAVKNPDFIGEQVCKDGKLVYQGEDQWSNTGRVGNQRIDGQVIAFIEGHSPDFSRVKLRIKGYAAKRGTFSYMTGTTPSLNGISAPQGTIIWESTNNGWYTCN